MILYQSSFLRLDFSPDTEVLEIEYPDFEGYILGEIKAGANILVEHVREYNIKKALMDSSQVENFLSEEDLREVSSYLIAGLAMTNLKKLARLQTPNQNVDTMAKERLGFLFQQVAPPFQLRNFANREMAMEWLGS